MPVRQLPAADQNLTGNWDPTLNRVIRDSATGDGITAFDPQLATAPVLQGANPDGSYSVQDVATFSYTPNGF